VLVQEWLESPDGRACFACLYAPDAVARCTHVGQSLELTLGSPPLAGSFTVRSLHDGKFEEPEPRHGGLRRFDQGRTAIVTLGERLTLMLTSFRTAPFSLRQLTAFGVEPDAFQVLVAKGVHAPVAAYAPVCPTLIRVNTPGITSADLSQFAYTQRRRPLYPFELDTPWTPS
jgi:microcystin degradation protein MlrC